ncbi:translation initiation factor IF-2-like [Phyllostomus discolor]|uniref:Translation initiation factor IF-2-like n=1 Tax=Phyllostomus discolor TaxID=89673 RepID=A0A7E6EF99_9CHIR|nr:translation initiation factor IF-2-like [Phyllostomus discolor]
MAAPPAADKEEQPPPLRRRHPRPRRGPARNEKPIYPSLSLCCFLAYITINARPVSVCRGRGESSREGRASGRAAAPAPRSGAPSATLSTSPLLAPALPGHLPPSTPRSLSARGEAPPTRRKRPTGGEEGNKTRPAQAGGEQLPSPPSPPSPPPALLCPSRHLALLLRQPPPPPVPPLPLHQLHPGNSEAAAFGKPRQFPPRPSSATLGPPPFPRATPARRLRQTSARSSFPLPLPQRPGSTPRHPSVLSGCRCFPDAHAGHCRSSLRRLLPGDQLEAGPRSPGVRREGAAFGRRTVGRQRSHLGLNKGGWGYCACAEVGAQEGGGCPRRALGLQAPAPPGCGRVVANRSVGDGRTVILELPPRAATEAAVSEVGSARLPSRALFVDRNWSWAPASLGALNAPQSWDCQGSLKLARGGLESLTQPY